MRYSIGHIFRRPGLDRAAFRSHYESRHTRLAGEILPRFAHYVRNHVVACTSEDVPDCLSEFGLETDEEWFEIAAILGDERGRPLLEDELLFMDKSRNAPHAVYRRELAPVPAGRAAKYVLFFDGTVEPGAELIARLADEGLLVVTWCGARDGRHSWLFAWAETGVGPEVPFQALAGAGHPVQWCARVEEAKGYPDFR